MLVAVWEFESAVTERAGGPGVAIGRSGGWAGRAGGLVTLHNDTPCDTELKCI